MSEHTNNPSMTPWTPDWLRRTSPAAVVAMAELRQRTDERAAASRGPAQ
ncbi:MAG: hypothetical protein ABIR68_01485 [Ilumatobacteraceae bacterium]